MHAEAPSLARRDDRPADPWALLTGGSAGIVVGFAVDLLRLGVHEARQALATRSKGERIATRGWRCPSPCDAGAR
jgi:hypothetical protein